MTHKKRIFVSHSSKDNEVARRIVRVLEEHGCDVWYDENDLEFGQFRQNIEKGLRTCQVFMVLLSENACKSKWVQREIDAALALETVGTGLLIVPVLLSSCTVPPLLAGYKRLDFTSGQDYATELDHFVRTVNEQPRSAIAHASFPEPPTKGRRPSRPLFSLLIITLILVITGSGGIYLWTNSPHFPISNRNGLANPTGTATAAELYHHYTDQNPSQIYIPSDSWFNGTYGHGTCQFEGKQEYHALPKVDDVVACIAPFPGLTGNFAVQAKVTIVQGSGTGIVFGYARDYPGDYYFWSYCGYTGCQPPINAFLDHGIPNGRLSCLGPDPPPDYSSGGEQYCIQNCCAINARPGQPNILTVIVLQGEIYLYINAVFGVAISPAQQQKAQQITSPQHVWQTSGQVGFAALGSELYRGTTDVTLQYLKIWLISN
jgi:hypothetical protein